ncbi:nuclear transport factor 2 family protein [Amycolatopsis sp. AA4]|uniref:nuclear transport factor 2 family protein n=1 Tax=Actinomycetes TaxID=1760 RepID=UPI0001B55089|nr:MULTISPECIES: nuclear transport factor 2 family protein [Actinomycetes]ATY12604.1 nuclear transport factor 2 family protein [Amycolatopsis sp. AA4]
MNDDLLARVQRLEDLEAIRRLKSDYARTCDLGADPDALMALFAPDGEVVWRSNVFGEHRGHDAIRKWFSGVAGMMPWAAHFMVNPVIDVAPSGDTAHGRWDLLEFATMTGTDGYEPVLMTGWYTDEFRKVDGRWYFRTIDIAMQQMSGWHEGWVREPHRGGDPLVVAAGRALR